MDDLEPPAKMYVPNRMPLILAVRMHKSNVDQLATWCGGLSDARGLIIPTIRGNDLAEYGDYIIRDVKTGRFSTMTKEAFEAEYKEVLG